ncbi:hypothetical protein HPB52_008284 [Rhipicephalus sanguineus]|uniref:Uncharacterized protein n=1 Tax=Rhipicephalus sanguineus TaxID=34632 RepID=A0A9D4PM32_RHISA|nr:hypothetical protein HPB52_008284 [Rhipicephalus sanguineus]
MDSSPRAATAVDASRGISSPVVPKDYRIILPALPSGEAMRRAFALHCDVSGRPYRIDDFRNPSKTYPSYSNDPTRQEVKMKLYWLAFDVIREAIRRAFYEYGEATERDECTRSYARAAGRQSETQQSELIMDEEESEQASVPATPQKLTSSDDAAVLNNSKELSTTLDTNAEQRKETAVATAMSGQTRPAPAADAAPLEAKRLEISALHHKRTVTSVKSVSQHPLGIETEEMQGLFGNLNTSSMDLEVASSKRRHDSDDGAQEDEAQVKSEVH